MNAKLTFYIFLSCVACLASSCSSDAPDDGGKGSELTFDVNGVSRSAITTASSINQFAVYGNTKFPVDDTTLPKTIFDKTIVEYSAGAWRYQGIQYWFPKHEYSFVAIHPVSVLSKPGADPLYSNSTLSFKYTTPVSGDGDVDLRGLSDIVVATHRRMYKEHTSTPVRFGFFHIMSRIDFKLENDAAADIIKVSKIELEKVNRTGAFAITPATLSADGGQTDDYNFAWTGVTNNGPLIANIDVEVPEDETLSLFPDDNPLLVIPQPDNHDVIMHITYTMVDYDSYNEQFTMTAQSPIGGWEPGKVYTYSMSVNEATKEIHLTVTVKPWHPDKQSGVTVPES